MEYMIFNTLEIAENAELAIEQIGQLPIIGKRASDGEPQPTKQKTEKWDTPRQRKDGKWILARLPIACRTANAEQKAEFDSNYPHVIEEYNPDWFDEVLE